MIACHQYVVSYSLPCYLSVNLLLSVCLLVCSICFCYLNDELVIITYLCYLVFSVQIYGSLAGIKVLNLFTSRVVRVLGARESTDRFLACALYQVSGNQ